MRSERPGVDRCEGASQHQSSYSSAQQSLFAFQPVDDSASRLSNQHVGLQIAVDSDLIEL